jgi:PAS domain S-box-containing protein
MAPSTALLFVLYGFAAFLRARVPLNLSAYWIGVAVNSAGALIALVLLFLSSLGIRPEVEHLGFPVAGTVGGAPVGHMSPVTAICFLLASLSFLASLPSSSSRPWRARAAWLAAGALLATCSVLLLAYLYGSPLFYVGSLIPPAATTSIAFAALGAALVALASLPAWRQRDLAGPDPRASYPLVLVFVLLAVGIVTVGGLYYRGYENRYRAEMEQQLSAIAALKVDELVQYRQERLGDGSIFFKNAAFSALVRRAFDNRRDTAAHAELRTWLEKYQKHDQYDGVFLLDDRGAEWMAVPEGRLPVASVIVQRVPEILRSRETALQDFHRNEHDQKVYLTVLVPIFDGQAGRRALGILGLRIDPQTHLYPFIRRWPTSSRTAETLLIRRDGNDALVLNEPKFQEHTALTLRIPLAREESPIVKAALGQEGIVHGRDDPGVPVMAAVQAVPGSPWSLVARMDIAEVAAPLWERLWTTIVLVGVLLVSTGAGVGLVSRQRHARFYEEKYQTEQALRESRALTEALLDAYPESALFLAPDGRVLAANAMGASRLGRRVQDLVGQDMFSAFAPAVAARRRARFEAVLASGRPASWEDERDGHRYAVTFQPSLEVTGRVSAVAVFARDVTRERQAEEGMRLQAAAVEAAANGIVITDRDGHIVWVNAAFSTMTGYMREEAVGQTPRILKSGRHDTAFYKDLWRTICAGRVWHGQMVNRRKDGTLCDDETTITPVRDEAGAITHFVAIEQDVTERRRLQGQLAQSEKLAAMGQLLAGVAHELNNPLSVVIGYTALLRRTTDAAAAARAEKISAAATRCARIVKNFLALARQHEPERQTIELNQVVHGVVELLAYPLRVDGVEVVAKLDVSLPPISADPYQLQQVVVNLVTNAHQAMRQASRPRRLSLTTHRAAGVDRVRLEVEDTGPGITPEVEARLFEPFFTTKPVGEGTGLGLSICKGIVESHGGAITVDGRPGRGARFTVELPIGASALPTIADEHEVPALRGFAILVVDDEREVAEMIAEMVGGEGCRVAMAGNGRQALDVLAREMFDVVITDLKMPEMDGVELYREIAQRHPALRRHVVFVTGDTLTLSTAEFLRETGARSVRKPFSEAELRSAVHAAREGSPPAEPP